MISAELAVLDATDPDTANNSGTIALTATPSPAGVVASAVRALCWSTQGRVCTRGFRARDGTGGSPVRPAGITCAATVGKRKLGSTRTAAKGTATCRFKTPKSAKGLTVHGSISFTASGTAVRKRFTVRLG